MEKFVKELLKENNKALQFIHYVTGMDFTKPFEVVRGEDTFTPTTIKKMITLPVEDCKVVLLVQPQRYSTNRFHYVEFDGKNFKTDFDNRFLKTWKYNTDNFYSKSSFEETRKKNTDHYYVICQRTCFLTTDHKEPQVDFTDRCVDVEKYYSYIRFKQNNTKIEMSNTYHEVTDFDKSGYYTKNIHTDYQRRVNFLKQEKAQKEAQNTDCTKYITKINDLKTLIKNVMLTAVMEDDTKTLSTISSYYTYAVSGMDTFINHVENRTFKSVKQIEAAFNGISRWVSCVLENDPHKTI